ncbi:FxSxx-COOH system tetratricopeptide repeat protein [Frankia sp. AgKG'84/4]|uniref:FxSxx-COOH system tetratricopeptide repeat protein n=1 Tax=Frankia sp. AgKG'84/4 TaxID=573490 RepID=UPI00200D42D6|nr:FxSxx-COOH system tetratricopeptide repeat protein [Frankia sp. AgKG'84/4]MCL9793422.1 FxSxx-COOH system tetratricopeptide repeat protein [Frankia sp. AgKG'84/4]
MVTETRAAGGAVPNRAVPVVWGSVPQRNKNFTGRETLLSELRRRVTSEVTAVLPHALQGLGGVGKTQLAIEYAYRFASDYQVVWWVPADQTALARSALAALAPRLGLTVAPGRIEDAVAGVLDALRRGEPYRNWLLIFDNADQPEMIREFLPHGSGNVLVTSRNHRWQSMADTVEVDVFRRAESLEFLHRRVQGIRPEEADQLAEALGDLPLALEQAGALQAETGMAVADYLDLLNQKSAQLLAENPPSDYPVPVAAAWSLSVTQLREQMPFAMELLRRCAFFGPEPISRDLLILGRFVLDSPLREALADPIMVSRAMRELGRYALARIDNNRKTLQVHRLIQKLIRDELSPAETDLIRDEVHRLLRVADPDDPDDVQKWPAYDNLLPHVTPSSVVESPDPDVRRLFNNIIRYLYNVGDTTGCIESAELALSIWGKQNEAEPDRNTLIAARRKADALWSLGRYEEAYESRRHTMEQMRHTLGPDDQETLFVTLGHGADLRVRGDFVGARVLDEEILARLRDILGDDHADTFLAANNLAVDYELAGDYERARALDEKTLQDRRDFYGRDDDLYVIFSLNAVARDLRQAGKYRQARGLAEQAYQLYQQLTEQVLPKNHAWVLLQAKDLSVARRLDGDFEDALALARDTHQRYVENFLADHPDTLAAAVNLGNSLRRIGSLEAAAEIIERSVEGYRRVLITDHPYTHASILNLAVIRRQIGRDSGDMSLIEDSKDKLEEALAGLDRALGADHHLTLTCQSSLAAAVADLGDVERARELDQETLPLLTRILGPEHPHTLMCASNLALDLRLLGLGRQADVLASETLARYRQALGAEHTDVLEMARGNRLDFVFEPSPF